MIKLYMNEIIDILVNRDEMSVQEATDLVQEVQDLMYEALENGSIFEVESIFEDMLGLESDYIEKLLY